MRKSSRLKSAASFLSCSKIPGFTIISNAIIWIIFPIYLTARPLCGSRLICGKPNSSVREC
jgi:hypothetical protein